MLWGKYRLEDVEYSKNPHLIYAQFNNQISGIVSQTYPFLNSLMNLIIEDNNQTRIEVRPALTPILEQQAIDYLRSRSLKDALHDNSLEL